MFSLSIWNLFPGEVQEICVNMMFNLGRPRFSKFKKTINYLEEHNWKEAGKEARDSLWYKQVGNRAERLCSRLESI
jgi:lysozyme